MRGRNRSGSTTPTQETETPREVYRLMSMTGANLHEALYCWKTASEDLYGALQIYVERIYPQNPVLRATPVLNLEDEDSEASSEGSQNPPNFFKRLIGPGMYFLKGVMAAAVLFVAIDALQAKQKNTQKTNFQG